MKPFHRSDRSYPPFPPSLFPSRVPTEKWPIYADVAACLGFKFEKPDDMAVVLSKPQTLALRGKDAYRNPNSGDGFINQNIS